MTRSIFDPTGRETEHSGSTFLPPDAAQISQLPPEVGADSSDDESAVIDLSADAAPLDAATGEPTPLSASAVASEEDSAAKA